MGKEKYFLVFLLLLFSLPHAFSFEFKILNENHSLINNEVQFLITNNNPSNRNALFDFNILNIDPTKVLELKIYKKDTKTIHTIVYEDQRINCPNEPIPDRNGFTCPTFNNIRSKVFCETIENCYRINRTNRIVNTDIPYWKILNSPQRFVDNSRQVRYRFPQINFSGNEASVYKVTWKNKLDVEASDRSAFQNKGTWSINPLASYNSAYNARRKLTIGAASAYDKIRIYFDANTTSGYTNILDTNFTSDGNEFIFVNHDGTEELAHNLKDYNDDTNAIFDVNLGVDFDNNYIWVYYGNDNNSLNRSKPHEVYEIYDDFEDGAINNYPHIWTPFPSGGNWSVLNGRLRDTASPGTNIIYTSLDNNTSFADGFLLESQVYGTCVDCYPVGVSLYIAPHDSHIDANGYEVNANHSTNNLSLQERREGNNETVDSKTVSQDAGTIYELRRDNGADLNGNLNYQKYKDVAFNNNNTTITKYIYVGANSATLPSPQWEYVLFTTKFNWDANILVNSEESSFNLANFSITSTKVSETQVKLQLIDTTKTDESAEIDRWRYLIDSVTVHNSTLIGDSNNILNQNADYNITLIIDLNTGVQSQLDRNYSSYLPTITLVDQNLVGGGFGTDSAVNKGNLYAKCSHGDPDETLTITFELNDTNVSNQSADVNELITAQNVTFLAGDNNLTVYCSDQSNNFDIETLAFTIHSGNFYFVFDETGVALTSGTDYTLADVNSLKVYSLRDQNFLDLYAEGLVSFFYTGDNNDSLEFRIGYTDPTFPFTTRHFDFDVLDVNSVPVCFSNLQTFYQQLMYSSVERKIILKNRHNGCYHLAAATDFTSTDSFSISAYTIPQSYNLRLVRNGDQNILAIVDGASAGQINLDALILKDRFAQNIIITGEGATIQKACTDGTITCDTNTFIVYYINGGNDNSSVLAEIYNGSVLQLSRTETDNPNEFQFYFDSSVLDFDANVLTLKITATRTDGSIKTLNVYFTPQGQVGYIPPEVALILSFLIFIGGITMVSTRLVFGWFGAVIALMGIAFLSFSVGIWYLTLMQAVLLSMLIYIGITQSQVQQGAF